MKPGAGPAGYMQPLAGALHWSAVMRRSQENELAQMPQPVMSIESAIIAGASGYQPAHAVPDNDQFLERRRPLGDKHLQQISKSPSVWRRSSPRFAGN